MDKDLSELRRIQEIKATSEKNSQNLKCEIKSANSELIERAWALDLKKAKQLSKKIKDLKRKLNNEEISFKSADNNLWTHALFEVRDIMFFFKELLSAFDNKEYELTATYLPDEEDESKFILSYIVAEKVNDYGTLDKIPETIKIQDASEYKKILIQKPERSFLYEMDFTKNYTVKIYWDYPFLRDAENILVSYRIGHPELDAITAIENVLSRYIPKYKNMPQEEKDKIMKRAI